MNEEDNKIIEYSKEPICPICKEYCFISIKDYKISLFKCKKNHVFKKINLDEYLSSQKIINSKKECNQCKKMQIKYFKCFNCKINLCSQCKTKHDQKHIIIDNESFNYICYEHNKKYISYCQSCSKNICSLCDHRNHNIFKFEHLLDNNLKNMNFLKEKISNLRKEMNELNNFITKLNKIVNNFETYFYIVNNLFNDLNSQKYNYKNIINMASLNNSIGDIQKDMNEIIYVFENLRINKSKKLIEDLNLKQSIINELKIKYKVEKNEKKIKIFGDEFVKNNKNNFKIFLNQHYYNLGNFLSNVTNDIEIKLIETSNATDLSYMFCGCSSLLSIEEIKEWTTDFVKDMKYMFCECKNLEKLPDNLKWNTSEVINLENMFCCCSKIKTLPDISNWDVSRVAEMNDLFTGCSTLKSLPDISKWNVSNIQNMSNMFSGCSNLKTLPDISNWNISSVNDMCHMFSGCSNLKSLPDISKWDLSKADFSEMFSECNLLQKIPKFTLDIIKYLFKDEEDEEEKNIYLDILDKLKLELLREKKTGDKKNIDIEIKTTKANYFDTIVELFTLGKNNFSDYFDTSNECIKNAPFVISLIIELKKEEDFDKIKNNIDKYWLINTYVRKVCKKIFIEIPFKSELIQKIILNENLDLNNYFNFSAIIKKGFFSKDCYKENEDDEADEENEDKNINPDNISFYFYLKSKGLNLNYIVNALKNKLKGVKDSEQLNENIDKILFTLNFISSFIGTEVKLEINPEFIIKQPDNEDSFEHQVKYFFELLNDLFKLIDIRMDNEFRENFNVIDVDKLNNISLSFGLPGIQNGITLVERSIKETEHPFCSIF